MIQKFSPSIVHVVAPFAVQITYALRSNVVSIDRSETRFDSSGTRQFHRDFVCNCQIPGALFARKLTPYGKLDISNAGERAANSSRTLPERFISLRIAYLLDSLPCVFRPFLNNLQRATVAIFHRNAR